MTLQELRSARHEDFFFAIPSRTLSWEEAKDVCIYTPDYPDGITADDALKISIEQALCENNEPITEMRKEELEKEVKQSITSHLQEEYNTIVLKHGDVYIDLSAMTEIGPEYEIKFLYPIKEYYSEGDYTFGENEEGKPYLKLDLEPFDRFVVDYSEGKFS